MSTRGYYCTFHDADAREQTIHSTTPSSVVVRQSNPVINFVTATMIVSQLPLIPSEPQNTIVVYATHPKNQHQKAQVKAFASNSKMSVDFRQHSFLSITNPSGSIHSLRVGA
jgi:hypothetical protein